MSLGELRRRDREMAGEEALECLDRALVGRIGTAGMDGWPYVVPLNFVYDDDSRTIFLHCATSGHLLDNLTVSPSACFEVDEPGPILAQGTDVCETSQVYRSVICFGQASIVSEGLAKRNVLHLFAQKYVQRLTPDREYETDFKTLGATTVIALRVEKMTGKKRPAS